MEIHHKETDVLVVGGGLAGCWAAIRAAQIGKRVILVDKSRVARSGASTFTNQMLAPTPPGEIRAWEKELVERGEYLNDQEWVETVLCEQKDRIQDLVDWGVPFERTPSGDLLVKRGRGHGLTGVVLCNGHTLMDIMRRKAEQTGVTIEDRTTITDLLTSDGQRPSRGRVCGAVGFHTREGAAAVYQAGAVVVAAGQIGLKMRCHFVNNLAGDGVAMVYRAGGELLNMEFCTTGNVSYFEKRFHVGSQALLVGMGAKFINARGERFMLRFDPVLGERSKLQNQVLAFVKEAVSGRGPCYWDMTGFNDEDVEMVRRLLPTTLRPFDEAGIDIRQRPVECTPVVQLMSAAGEGGIRVDGNSQTTVPGLYAAGASARNPVHGVYSVGGVNLAFCNVGGYRAGEAAARNAFLSPLPQGQLQSTLENTFAFLSKKGGARPDDIVRELQAISIPAKISVYKSEERIKHTLEKIRELRKKLAGMRAADIHDLVKAVEAQNLVQIAELIFMSSLERKESRAWHFREDYPYRDDQEWLRWIIVKMGEDGQPQTRKEQIPLDRYEFKMGKSQKTLHPLAGE
ncbi:MAG: FAD-binding protein [Chloroflexi bacterium]|nr:FAD-binding protein [Chloroflexota bacterium]